VDGNGRGKKGETAGVPDAIWFAFFSCSVKRGFSSCPLLLPFALPARAPSGLAVAGDDLLIVVDGM
jgi:hypothetical protein